MPHLKDYVMCRKKFHDRKSTGTGRTCLRLFHSLVQTVWPGRQKFPAWKLGHNRLSWSGSVFGVPTTTTHHLTPTAGVLLTWTLAWHLLCQLTATDGAEYLTAHLNTGRALNSLLLRLCTPNSCRCWMSQKWWDSRWRGNQYLGTNTHWVLEDTLILTPQLTATHGLIVTRITLCLLLKTLILVINIIVLL